MHNTKTGTITNCRTTHNTEKGDIRHYSIDGDAVDYLWVDLDWFGTEPPQLGARVLFGWVWCSVQPDGGPEGRLITRYQLCAESDLLPTHSVGIPTLIPASMMNETVAFVKELVPLSDATDPQNVSGWSLRVKHRTAGPRDYWLAFRPDENELQPNTMVRIWWVARDDATAKQHGIALRVKPIGTLQYRDEVTND